MKKWAVACVAVLVAVSPAAAGFHLGLGKAAAKRSAAVINEAGRSVAARESDTSTTGSSRRRWRYLTDGMNYSAPAIAPDGTVYIGTSGHFVAYNAYWQQGQKPPAAAYGLYAFNSVGAVLWKYSDGTDAPVRGSPALASDGTIYIVIERLANSEAGTTQELHAVNPDGTQKWKVSYANSYSQIGALTPSVATDGTIYVAGSALFAFNPDGTSKWTAPHGPSNTFYASPAIGADGTIYHVYWNLTQVLQALNPDGSVKWTATQDLGTIPITCSPSIAADGTIYIGSVNSALGGSTHGTLWAFDSSGNLTWSYDTGDYDVRGSPAIDADGTVYFGTKGNHGYIYALNSDGTLKWRHASAGDTTPGIGVDVYASPAIGSDGIIYTASESGWFYAFNRDGTLAWKDDQLNPLGGITWSSPAIDADGTLYVGSAYGEFIAVTTTSAGLSTTAQWPKFHYNLANTAQHP